MICSDLPTGQVWLLLSKLHHTSHEPGRVSKVCTANTRNQLAPIWKDSLQPHQ